jgi:hypothetical protein
MTKHSAAYRGYHLTMFKETQEALIVTGRWFSEKHGRPIVVVIDSVHQIGEYDSKLPF